MLQLILNLIALILHTTHVRKTKKPSKRMKIFVFVLVCISFVSSLNMMAGSYNTLDFKKYVSTSTSLEFMFFEIFKLPLYCVFMAYYTRNNPVSYSILCVIVAMDIFYYILLRYGWTIAIGQFIFSIWYRNAIVKRDIATIKTFIKRMTAAGKTWDAQTVHEALEFNKRDNWELAQTNALVLKATDELREENRSGSN